MSGEKGGEKGAERSTSHSTKALATALGAILGGGGMLFASPSGERLAKIETRLDVEAQRNARIEDKVDKLTELFYTDRYTRSNPREK